MVRNHHFQQKVGRAHIVKAHARPAPLEREGQVSREREAETAGEGRGKGKIQRGRGLRGQAVSGSRPNNL